MEILDTYFGCIIPYPHNVSCSIAFYESTYLANVTIDQTLSANYQTPEKELQRVAYFFLAFSPLPCFFYISCSYISSPPQASSSSSFSSSLPFSKSSSCGCGPGVLCVVGCDGATVPASWMISNGAPSSSLLSSAPMVYKSSSSLSSLIAFND